MTALRLCCHANTQSTLQDGLTHLDPPRGHIGLPWGHTGLPIWDMSTPPTAPLREGVFPGVFSYVGHVEDRSRFCTVDLTRVAGLTFFLSNGVLVSVIGHMTDLPQVEMQKSFDLYRGQRSLCSVYVPMAVEDRITALEVRQSTHSQYQILVKHTHTPSPILNHRTKNLTRLSALAGNRTDRYCDFRVIGRRRQGRQPVHLGAVASRLRPERDARGDHAGRLLPGEER